MLDDREFPTSPKNIDRWCQARNLKRHEGKRRFVGFVILECIAAHHVLGKQLAFKGGNALRFCYQSPRSTTDLDFTALTPMSPHSNSEIQDNADTLRALINEALEPSERRFNVKTKCQSIIRNPKRTGTQPTYEAHIAYQFPDDRNFNYFDTQIIATTIDMEVSLSDVVCETCEMKLEPASTHLVQVCSLNDIVAEKLRSLLQQPLRRRNRAQDVYDIARIYRISVSQLNFKLVAQFLIQKANAKGISPSRSLFDEEIKKLSMQDYNTRIRNQTNEHFIEFDAAWKEVVELVERLPIPH